MVSNEHFVNELMEKIAAQIIQDIKESINQTIEREITTSLSKTLLESEFHRRINEELQSGLRDIYKEIAAANKEAEQHAAAMDTNETEQLFSETSDQLDKIIQATEKATTDIMEIIEKHLELQGNAHQMLEALKTGITDPGTVEKLASMNDQLNADLMQILTTLSFQDITGQRIKRVINALKKVEQTVFDLYMYTGLKLKGRQEAPDKDFAQLEREAKEKVVELKGPQTGVSQHDIDDLLAQLR